MNFRKVPARSGWNWIRAGFSTLAKRPQVFLVMGLIIAFIQAVPVLGSLVILILGPALTGGTVYAAQRASTGSTPQIGNLFRAFQQSERTGPMIALCLPGIAAIILAGVALGVLAAQAYTSGAAANIDLQDPMALAALLGAGALIVLPVMLIVLVISYALIFFAVSLVQLAGIPAFKAMKASFAASFGNFGAFIIACLALGLGTGLLTLILISVHLPDFLASLVSGTLLYSVLGPILWAGYRQVFLDMPSADEPSRTPSAAPPPETMSRTV